MTDLLRFFGLLAVWLLVGCSVAASRPTTLVAPTQMMAAKAPATTTELRVCRPDRLSDYPAAGIAIQDVTFTTATPCRALSSARDGAAEQTVYDSDILVLTLESAGEKVRLNKIDGLRIEGRVRGKDEPFKVLPIDFEAYKSRYYARFAVKADELGAHPSDRIELKVTVTFDEDKDTEKEFMFHTVYAEDFVGYGDALNFRSNSHERKGAVGLWVPVGLFATNFQETTDGLQFNVLPVSGAIGTKGYLGSWYFGLSGFPGWAWDVNPVDETPSAAEADNEQQEGKPPSAGFSVGSTALGFLVDFNGHFYLGGAHIWNFESGVADPGYVGVIGLPVDVLN